MKLSDYVPSINSVAEKNIQLSELTNALTFLQKSSGGDTYRSPTLGLDQIVSSWIRQQMAYRQQMVLDLIVIAETVAEIRTAIQHLTGEVFRRGIQWKPAFAVKCANEDCGKEFQQLVEECTKCGGVNLTPPDESQKSLLEAFFKNANVFNRSFETVLKQLARDMNVVDDAFLYIVKEYKEDGESVVSRPIELRRLHPALVEFDLDMQGMPKSRHFVCYIHRDKNPQAEPGNCLECGRELQPAMYTYYNRNKPLYLLDKEVVHVSKFSPSETYGFSPILTIFEKALTLIGMDKNLYRYFWERRMPQYMIMVSTDNPESLRRERENIASKMRMDPNYVPMIAVSQKTGRGRVDTVKLFHTLQEMDYLPVRQEIRERISAIWGVTPAWMMAPDAFGGLSAQNSQLTVMSRVVEGDQRIFMDDVFPTILEAFGVTDWSLFLPQPEEEAESTRLQFAQQKIMAANLLLAMGFDLKLKSTEAGISDIDFLVSGSPVKPQQMMAGLGGGGGQPQEGEEQGPSDIHSAELGGVSGPDVNVAKMWAEQLLEKGFFGASNISIAKDGNSLTFSKNGSQYTAPIVKGSIGELKPLPPIHQHDGLPPHVVSMPHPTSQDVIEAEKEDVDEADTEGDIGF